MLTDQLVFLLDRGHAQRQTHEVTYATHHPSHALGNYQVGSHRKLETFSSTQWRSEEEIKRLDGRADCRVAQSVIDLLDH